MARLANKLVIVGGALIVQASSALAEPPLASARGLRGMGPFGLMRAVDLDRDGRDELLVEDANGRLVALEIRLKSQPATEQRVISVDFADLREISVGDLDRDGDLDVVSVGDSEIRWHEQLESGDPNGGARITRGWSTVTIATSATPSAVGLGDFDRDGDLDVLAPSMSGLDLVWYRNDPIEESIEFVGDIVIALDAAAVGVAVVDLNRDGWLDVASISARGLGIHLRDPGLASFTTTFVDLGMAQVRDLVAHDADQDTDIDLLIVGDDRAVLATNADGLGTDWVVSVIGDGLVEPRRGHVGDLDGDAKPDYLIEGGGQSAIWFPDSMGGQPFEYRVGVRTYGPIVLSDVDGDGDEDLVGSIAAGSLLWRENGLIHRSISMPRRGDIELELDGAFNVITGDLDGDGDIDLASAAFNADTVSWHENLGGGVFLIHPVLSSTNGPVSVIAVDLDLDGRLDLASASTNDDTISWHRNMGGAPPTFETFVVANDADGVFSLSAGDLDGDGRIDLVSAEKNTDRVRWFRNVDVGGVVEFSPGLVKGGVRGAFNVRVADVDGDGRADVLSASRDDDSIRLMRNLGGDPLAFETIILTSRADGVACVEAGDLDGDGDLDVVCASRSDGAIRWFVNDGNNPPSFQERGIDSGIVGATWVRAADLDGDGDVDLVAAIRNSGLIHVYTNDGATAPSFSRRILSEPAAFASCVEPGDFDGDGKIDIVVAAVSDDLLAWYRNEGGSFAFAGSSIAPETVPAWGVAGLLQIDAASRAHEGGGDILLESLTLRFEDDAGVAMTSGQLALLVQRLTIYADTGDEDADPDGIFDPLFDKEVLSLETIPLDAGEIVIEIPQGEKIFSPGSERTFFIAVRMAENAGNQSPNSFSIALASSAASDARNGSDIAIEDPRAVATPIITATCPADMTGSDDPDDPAFGVPDGVVDQIDFSYFNLMHAAGDPSADLTGTNDRTDPDYAIPDGNIDGDDLFFYLDRFDEGC